MVREAMMPIGTLRDGFFVSSAQGGVSGGGVREVRGQLAYLQKWR